MNLPSDPSFHSLIGSMADALTEHGHPPLPAVRRPIADVGQALVQSLLSQRAGERRHSTRLATTLVVRDSSGAPGAV